jgi:ribosome-interacting GTPase 1
MVNYQNGKIYKIESNLGNKIYIGSTTKDYLSQRMDKHRKDFKEWVNKKNSSRRIPHLRSFDIFEEYGLENCKIILIECCPCNSKDELVAKEAYYIKTLECVNKVIPNRTSKEYKEDNKEWIKEKNKKFYDEHKDEIYERNKAYYKEYREKNKEKIKEYMANYRAQNKKE